MLAGQFGVDRWGAIRAARATMNRMDLGRETDILACQGRLRTAVPAAEAVLGDLEQTAHDLYRTDGLVCLRESEERFGVAVLSFANQAAAMVKISRYTLTCRFSTRSRVSSWRPAVLCPPSPRPPSRSARLTHCRIDQDVQPNSFPSSSKPRPGAALLEHLSPEFGLYTLFDFAILDT